MIGLPSLTPVLRLGESIIRDENNAREAQALHTRRALEEAAEHAVALGEVLAIPAVDLTAIMGQRAPGADQDAHLPLDPRWANLPTSPDAALLALGREWHVSAERCDRADVAIDAAYEHLVEPAPPDALFWRPRDPFGMAIAAGEHHSGRRWYGFPGAIDSLRTLQLVDCVGRPLVRDRARRAEVVEAYDRWQAEIARAWNACGLDVAEAESDAAQDQSRDLRRRIMMAEADTLAGVLVKARVAGWCWRGSAEMREQSADNVRRGSSSGEDIAFSLAADLVAMIERGAA